MAEITNWFEWVTENISNHTTDDITPSTGFVASTPGNQKLISAMQVNTVLKQSNLISVALMNALGVTGSYKTAMNTLQTSILNKLKDVKVNNATHADSADNATNATNATNASNASYATSSGSCSGNAATASSAPTYLHKILVTKTGDSYTHTFYFAIYSSSSSQITTYSDLISKLSVGMNCYATYTSSSNSWTGVSVIKSITSSTTTCLAMTISSGSATVYASEPWFGTSITISDTVVSV